jgi:hypothetical protein
VAIDGKKEGKGGWGEIKEASKIGETRANVKNLRKKRDLSVIWA